MLNSLKNAAEIGWRRFVAGPRRLRTFQRQKAPYLFRSPDGLLFRLEPGELVDSYIAADGVFERRFLEQMRRLMPPAAVMLDIGANIGNHALFLRDSCSAIHCFEPNPRAWRRLEEHIELNHANHISVHRFGLGERDAQLDFHDNVSGNLGAGGFVDHGGAVGDGFDVIQLPIRAADQAIDELRLDRVDFIKIDVEGYEAKVLDALAGTIARTRPLIAFEHHGQSVDQAGYEHIRSLLREYVIAEMTFAPSGSTLAARVLWHLRHNGIAELTRVDRPDARSYDNLIAIPKEHSLAQTIVG